MADNRLLIAMLATTAYITACGGGTASSPTQPTAPDLSGTWAGTMRASSVAGFCAFQLQYLVGGSSQFSLRLTQNGSALTGTIEPGKGACDVAGSVTGNKMTLTTTTCRPRDRTTEFFVCEGNNSEFVIKSLVMETSVDGAVLTGKYIYADDIRSPVSGPVVGVLTENGDVTLTRR